MRVSDASASGTAGPSALGPLASCWHPVAFAADVAVEPVAVTLLGEPVVVWRDSAGVARAMTDVCIHRGTALSLGRVSGDEIVCPYHGWRYDGTGRCRLIPQLEQPDRVPQKACVTTFGCTERHGLIWVALEPPRWDLPDVPELAPEASGSWRAVPCGPYDWEADASRQLENFTDFGHFPWVHPGLLGDPERPVVPDYSVRTAGHVLSYDIVRPEAANSEEFPIFANEERERPTRRSHYEVHLPYTLLLRLGWGGESAMVYFFASQPVDADHCRGWLFVARNYDLEADDDTIRRFEDVIFEQDRRIVESQRPERVPFDITAEIHLKFDAVAVAYRRAMSAVGLASPAP
ncbi:MAG: aromatic ring-hydroxylating dioxygenase subunit alpha [Acidimicrobiales bacterium]|jgi:vanillate O-demethylase monooxygenase subunit